MPEQVGRSVRFALDGGERKGGKGKRLHHKSNIHLLNEEEAAALSDAHWDIYQRKKK
jgi:hypothetical protein